MTIFQRRNSGFQEQAEQLQVKLPAQERNVSVHVEISREQAYTSQVFLNNIAGVFDEPE